LQWRLTNCEPSDPIRAADRVAERNEHFSAEDFRAELLTREEEVKTTDRQQALDEQQGPAAALLQQTVPGHCSASTK